MSLKGEKVIFDKVILFLFFNLVIYKDWTDLFVKLNFRRYFGNFTY